MGDEPPKQSRKYRWAATTANILYVLALVVNVWSSRVRQLRCLIMFMNFEAYEETRTFHAVNSVAVGDTAAARGRR